MVARFDNIDGIANKNQTSSFTMFKIIFLSSISCITVKVEKKLRKIKNISVGEKIYLT
jgi:hypothetical protein